MSDNTDWNDVVCSCLFFSLIFLCLGEPDLLDAIISRVGR